MLKIDKIKDNWGDVVIRVWKCENFENDKNIPKNPTFDLHNTETEKISDILNAVENYFYNSGK